MADEIYINQGTQIQQPYQGQVAYQAFETTQRITQVSVNRQGQQPYPFIYQSPMFTKHRINSQLLRTHKPLLHMQDRVSNHLLTIISLRLHIRTRLKDRILLLEMHNNRIRILQMLKNQILEMHRLMFQI